MFDVAVVDYGVGNVTSVRNAFLAIGTSARTATTPQDLQTADLLVLPGVGAFAHCMQQLKSHGLTEFLIDYSRSDGPLLGICVGMQMLFEQSLEFGTTPGLGLVPGVVRKLSECPEGKDRVKVPHVGWAQLNASRPWASTMLNGLDDRAFYYFVHSYAPEVHSDGIIADASHGGTTFGAVAGHGRTLGCQFHPERSGRAGLDFLRVIVTNVSKSGRP